MNKLEAQHRWLDGSPHTVYEVVCRECGATHAFKRPNFKYNPSASRGTSKAIDDKTLRALEKELDRLGWQHKHDATRCVCPKCIEAKSTTVTTGGNVVQFKPTDTSTAIMTAAANKAAAKMYAQEDEAAEAARPGWAWMTLGEIRHKWSVDHYVANLISQNFKRHGERQRNGVGAKEFLISLDGAENAILRHMEREEKKRAPATGKPLEDLGALISQPAPAKDTPAMPAPAPAPTPTNIAPHRPASPADRRRIQDALDAAYDVENGRYRKDGSDAAIAQQLDVPKLWVRETRQFSYGYGDGNEAIVMKAQMADKFEKRIADLEAQFKAMSDGFAKTIDKLKADIHSFRS